MSDLFEILACELKKNNVFVEIHKVASPNLLPIGENIVGEKIILDFSKHDKVFEDKISELKAKIAIKDMDYKTASELLGKYQRENEVLKKRIQELRTRCTECARDNFDKEIYGCLSIVSYPKEIDNQNKELKKRIAELKNENEQLKHGIDKMAEIKSKWIDRAVEWQQKCEKLEGEHHDIGWYDNRHQSDCIEINRLNTTIDVLIHKVEYLRQFAGLE